MKPRKILRIARWEVTKNAGGIDRKTIAVVGVTVLLLGAVAPLVAAQGGVTLDQGIYRVGIEEESPLYPVVKNDPTFAIRDPDAELGEEIDVRVRNIQAVASSTPKGEAALAELRNAVINYNDRIMRKAVADGGNESAAFPVSVTLKYVERSALTVANNTTPDSDTNGENGTDGTTGNDSSGGGNDTGEGTAGGGGTRNGGGGGSGAGGGLANIARSLTGSSGTTGTPSDIAPPFPFQSLVLAFVFVLPLNFVIQAYGSTILSERINRRGELMLVAPVSRGDIISGKTLPYFLGAMAFEVVITGGIIYTQPDSGSGLFSILAVVPLVLLFLSATFLGAMFARSFKELTFVTVAITVSLTSYTFVPAIFTEVTPIALISPLTIVVRDIQGLPISLTALGFSILPPLFTAMLFFGLGAGLYREEDMFTQRPIPLKVLDSLAGRIKRARSVFVVVILLIPLVILAELVAMAAIFPITTGLPRMVWLSFILLAIVVIEEAAKSLPVYAGFVHNRYERSLRSAMVVGALAGAGFFVAEKGLLLVRLLPVDNGLPEVQRSAVASSGPVGDLGIAAAALLLLAPLALHVVTATASAIGGRRGRRGYAIGFTVAVAIHFAYNLTVVMLFVQ